MTRWLTKACTGAESDHRVTAGNPVMLLVSRQIRTAVLALSITCPRSQNEKAAHETRHGPVPRNPFHA